MTAEAQARIAAEVETHWQTAQHYWSRFLILSSPEVSEEPASIAQIQLGTRQVSLNSALIAHHDLFDCILGLLAHELGHHVRYPGTLVVEARMRLLERSIIPLQDYSLTNVFQDLMINEYLGGDLKEQFIRIYQAFTSEPAFHANMRWKRDPAFLFYLSLYEVLWQLKPGELTGKVEAAFSKEFPGYRAEAHVLVHNLFSMEPNIYTQFLYFTSVMTRYLKPMIDDTLQQYLACQCGADAPSPDDWADALTPTGAEQQAIDQAIKAGWFEVDQAERLRKLNELEERIASLPGFGADDATLIPEVMAAHYRQLAERHLVKPPPLPRMGEAIVPTTHETWEHSDPVRDIDWLATLAQYGSELGVVQPLKRTPIAETEGYDVRLWQPRMEIYLDISGSMPNPVFQLNAMTLAAQILTLGTTRAGGSVRAALYSSDTVVYWSWCRSDVEISKFLMHYVGGGTDFPFELLRKSCDECGRDQPIRVIISDQDFDSNYESDAGNRGVFVSAATRSPQFVLLLHRPDPGRCKFYRDMGATVVEIDKLSDFPRLTAALTHSLFPENHVN